MSGKYKITPWSMRQAERLGVIIKPSKNSKKKIDIFDKRTGDFITNIGARGYGDYGTYLETKGRAFADEKRRLYRIRHKDELNKIGTTGWYASEILW